MAEEVTTLTNTVFVASGGSEWSGLTPLDYLEHMQEPNINSRIDSLTSTIL